MIEIVRATVLPQPPDGVAHPGWVYVDVPAWGVDPAGGTGTHVWAQLVSQTSAFAMPDVGAPLMLARNEVGDTPYVVGQTRFHLPPGAGPLELTSADTSSVAAKEALTPKVDQDLVRAADAAAARHGVPPALFRGTISKESTWRPKAYNLKAARSQWKQTQRIPDHKFYQSGKAFTLKDHTDFKDASKWGAYGLGQVMLLSSFTAGHRFDADADDLFGAEHNLEVCARLMGRYFARAKGDVRWASAMYHTGPGNAKTPDPATWPAETQQYTADVYGFYLAEKALLTTGGTLSPTAHGTDDETTSGLKGTASVNTPAATAPVSGSTLQAAQTVPQPATAMKAKYPHNSVHRTKGGHVEELDDTPGAERRAWHHPAGAFEEVGTEGQKSQRYAALHEQVDGRKTQRSGRRLDVVECERRTHTCGEEIRSMGSLVESVDGRTDRVHHGDVAQEVKGMWSLQVLGEILLKAIGPLTLVGTNLGIGAKELRLVAGAGEAEMLAATTARVAATAGGSVELGMASSPVTKLPVLTVHALTALSAALAEINAVLAAMAAADATLAAATGLQLAALETTLADLAAAASTGLHALGPVRTVMTKAD